MIKKILGAVAFGLLAAVSNLAGAVPLSSFPATVNGELDAYTDGLSAARTGGFYYADRYEIAVTPGQQLTIDMTTTDFDGYLYLLDAQNNVVAYSDDYTSTRDSHIVYTAQTSGTLTIETTSFSANIYSHPAGTPTIESPAFYAYYTLQVQSVGGGASGPTTISVPASLSGSLDTTDSRSQSLASSYADRYRMFLTAGQTVVIEETATFDAYLNLYDAYGTRIAYNDDFNGLNSRIEFTAPTSGDYVVEATSFGANATGTYTLSISQGAAQSTIYADFWASPSSGTAPMNVLFYNYSWSSNYSDQLTYTWDFGDGGMAYDYGPTHTYNTGGTYTVTLTVRNQAGQTNSFSTTITVQQAAASIYPYFSTSAYTYQANLPITFYNGTYSSDPYGGALSYYWDFGDGTYSYEQNPTHTFAFAGNFTVRLTASNSTGQSQSYSQALTVQPGMVNFTVSFRPSSTTVRTNESVTFVNQSYSPSGSYLTYTWDFGDGSVSYEANPTHAFTRSGSFVVRLTATDGMGQSQNYSQTVTVQQSTATLTSTFSAITSSGSSTLSGAAPLSIIFTNQSTSSLPTDVLTYQWNFGDGQTSTERNPTHSYTTAGTYVPTLTVTNSSGQSTTSTTTAIVTVSQSAASGIAVTGTTRLRPQVIMAGFDPILIDLVDTSFKLFNVVRPGAVELQTVQTATNTGGFAMAMTFAGTYPNGDQRYEVSYTFPRGAFPSNTILGDLFGSANSQFRMTAIDVAQQTHSFPTVEWGNNVALTTSVTSPSTPVNSTAGTVRLSPQVLAAGFDPQLIDLADTSFDVVAIVRAGVVPIQTVSVSQNQGGFSLAMTLDETLPNGDKRYKTTYTYQRGAFPEMRAADLFGTQAGQFNIIATDQAQQTHGFPELRWGNYPEITQP